MKNILVCMIMLWLALDSLLNPVRAAETPLQETLPPEYYEARREMVNGILLTSIGGGVGGIIAYVGVVAAAFGSKQDGLIYGGLAVMGGSLGLGIPMIVEGAREKKRILREHQAKQSATESSWNYGLVLDQGKNPGLSLSFRF